VTSTVSLRRLRRRADGDALNRRDVTIVRRHRTSLSH